MRVLYTLVNYCYLGIKWFIKFTEFWVKFLKIGEKNFLFVDKKKSLINSNFFYSYFTPILKLHQLRMN